MRKIGLCILCMFIVDVNKAQQGGVSLPASWPPQFVIADSLKIEADTSMSLRNYPGSRMGQGGFGVALTMNEQSVHAAWASMEGQQVRMYSIHYSGASALGLALEEISMTANAFFYLASVGNIQLQGPFTQSDISAYSTFTTLPVPGDELLLYTAGDMQFELMQLMVYETMTTCVSATDLPPCNNFTDVLPPGWNEQKRATVMLASAQAGFCTGVLLNNTNFDGKPYVLTAHHCLPCVLSQLANYQFIFNYETETNGGQMTQWLTGASVLEYDFTSDYALLLIDSGNPIPTDFNPFFAGWDATGETPDSVVFIHHPKGGLKSFSVDNEVFDMHPAFHHYLAGKYDQGSSCKGSSGGPYFNEAGLVVGQHFGALGDPCEADHKWAAGDFSNSFNVLGNWLAPNASGITSISGFDSSTPSTDIKLEKILRPYNVEPGALECDLLNPVILRVRNTGTAEIESPHITATACGGAFITTFEYLGDLAPGISHDIELWTGEWETNPPGFLAYGPEVDAIYTNADDWDEACHDWHEANNHMPWEFTLEVEGEAAENVSDNIASIEVADIDENSLSVYCEFGPYYSCNGPWTPSTEWLGEMTLYDEAMNVVWTEPMQYCNTACSGGQGGYLPHGTYYLELGGVSNSERTIEVTDIYNNVIIEYSGSTTALFTICIPTGDCGCRNPWADNYDPSFDLHSFASCTFEDHINSPNCYALCGCGGNGLSLVHNSDVCSFFFNDADGDGYGDENIVGVNCSNPPSTLVTQTGDCDDSDNTVYPGAPGTFQGIDNNCNNVLEPDEQITPGDLSGDGEVNVTDLLIFTSGFGCSIPPCIGDFDENGVTNVQDLLFFNSVF